MGTNSLVGDNSNRDDKRAYLVDRGWYPWYNEDYWCHPMKKPYRYCDCTNWGVSFDRAFDIEYQGKSKTELFNDG